MTSHLQSVQQNILAAAKQAKRNPTEVSLVAVSKTHPIETIKPIADQGQKIFGENKVQEAAQKWPELRKHYDDIKLHLIGPLQSNKVRQALQVFDVIETVDRPKLARAIARISQEENTQCDCYIQVNIGQEAQKAGIAPEQADDFIAQCRDDLKLNIIGLMCIPPAGEDPTPFFHALKNIANRNGLNKISMGMSSDYPLAIACGATSVRVGTAIFGARPKP